MLPDFLAGTDPDLADVLRKHCEKEFAEILLGAKVTKIEEESSGFVTTLEHEGETKSMECDRVLMAVGRTPNTDDLGLDKTGISPTDRGLIEVTPECRTAEEHIFAIGDVTPGPMLAHKASREGRVAAEVIAERKSAFDNRAIPAVVYSDPEIAWVGLTEREAKEQGVAAKVSRFPLRALGRAWTMGRTDGLMKILSDPESDTLLGVGMVGPHVSELIAEGALALEMGATLEDLLVTIHPHPTLSEGVMESAEVAAGTPIHIIPPKESRPAD
jgi:dihydrolipoamide dehydrogenase